MLFTTNIFQYINWIYRNTTIVNVLFFVSSIIFFKILYFWICYDVLNASLINIYSFKFNNFYWYLNLDGISLSFIMLTSFFIPLCILFSKSQLSSNKLIKDYTICLFCIELLLLVVFLISDILLFFIFFEAILIPFFIIIAIKGSRVRKIHASYLLFFYTVCGSILMLISILFIYVHTGTTMYQIFMNSDYTYTRANFIWFTFFLSFGIKLPIVPFHIWLPEAHVESPTEASVVLAAILLKVGSYGLLKILLPFLPEATIYYTPLILIMSCISILYASMSTLRQIDIKRIIAYSSVAHMNVLLIGLVTFDPVGMIGSLIIMIGHGIVSGGLFFVVGIFYYRLKTKLISYYSGIVNLMPMTISIFFFLVLGNISLPLTCNFVGEFLILYSIVKYGSFYSILSIGFSIFLGTCYTMLMFNKVSFGIDSSINNDNKHLDISILEVLVIAPIIFLLFLIGIYPKILFDILLLNVSNYEYYK